MRQFTIMGIACIALLTAAPPAARAGQGSERLHRFLDQVTTLTARFEQAIYDEDGLLLETSRGEVALHRPGRFRWDYHAPYRQLIVADGTDVWVYDQDLEQVTVRPVDASIGHSPALLLGTGESVEERFTLRELGRRDDVAWVYLAPKEEEEQFSALRLGFDRETLRAMELVDQLGQTTRLLFSGTVINPAVGESLFRFEPPAGVDVIRGE